jgi:hypothetical protein
MSGGPDGYGNKSYQKILRYSGCVPTRDNPLASRGGSGWDDRVRISEKDQVKETKWMPTPKY